MTVTLEAWHLLAGAVWAALVLWGSLYAAIRWHGVER